MAGHEIHQPIHVAGVHVAGDLSLASAAICRFSGRGLASRVEIVATGSAPIAAEVQDLYCELLEGAPGGETLPRLGATLAEAELMLVRDVMPPEMVGEVFLAGIVDPGLWDDVRRPCAFVPLSDPTRVAEATGLCIVDAFPARDLAGGGRGGPVDAIAAWLLLHDVKKPRVWVDAAQPITRMTYLPASVDGSGAARILSIETDEVARSIRDRIPHVPPLEQVVVRAKDATLIAGLASQLPDVEVIPLADLIERPANLDAALTACLAFLHLQQIPASGTAVTGIASPRVLGRLTPGSPQNWRAALSHLADRQQTRVPLRSAI